MNTARSVRIELLRPHEIEAALADEPTVYLPLGTIEWHSYHLPVGLDGLTAQGVCEKAACEHGGLVYPPLYFGTGGGHGGYPWTVMMPGPDHLRPLLEVALARLEAFGVRRAVLFSGHFADEQIAMVESVADDWNLGGGPLTAIGLGINMVEGAAIAPDHAGVFETTMLSALWPERVDLGQLPQTDSDPSDDDEGTRHDPSHELWGVFGPDPRRFDPSAGAALLDVAANWLARRAGTDR